MVVVELCDAACVCAALLITTLSMLIPTADNAALVSGESFPNCGIFILLTGFLLFRAVLVNVLFSTEEVNNLAEAFDCNEVL